MNRRKGLATNAILKLKYIFENKKISVSVKIKVINSYIVPIYLYNSELWTLTKEMRNSIDSFQRRIIRTNVFRVKWPKIMKNDEVYARSGMEPWSKTIDKRRLRWFGHVVRMDSNTPARKALTYAMQPYKRIPGRPLFIWISQMRDQLRGLGMSWDEAIIRSQDRKGWREIVNN